MAKLLLLLLPDTETPTTLQAAIAKEKSAAMAGLLAAAQHQPFAAVVQNFVAAHREVFAPLWLEEVRSAVTAHQPSAFFFPAAWLLASSDAPGTLCLLLKQGLVNLRLAKNDAERLQAVLGLTALFKNLAGFGNDAISSSFVQSVLSELPALLARPVDENSPDSVLAHASLVSLLTCVLEHLRLAPLAAFSDDGQPFQGRVASRGLANCCVDPAAFAVEAKEDWGEDDWEEAKPAEKPEKVETKPAEKVETKGMEKPEAKPEKAEKVKSAAKERRPRVKPARVVNTGFSDDEAPSAKPTRRRGKKNALLANFVAEDNRAASETPSPTPETMPEAVPEAAKQAEVAPSVPQVAAPLKVTAAGEDDWDEDWEAPAKPATPATGEVEWAVEEEGLKAERWSEDEEWVTVEKGGSKNGGDWGDEDWDVEGEVAEKPVEKKEEKPAEKPVEKKEEKPAEKKEEEAVKEETPVEEEKVEEKPEEVKREEKEEEKPEEEKKENPEEMKEEEKKEEKLVEEKEEEKKDVEPEAKPVEEKEEEKEENPAEKKEEKPEEMKEEVKKEEKPKEGEEKKEEVKEEKEYEKPAEKPEEEKTEEMKEEAKEEKPKEGEEKKEEEKEEKPEIVEEKKEETTAEKKEEKEEVMEEKEEETTIEKPVEEKEEVKDERSEEMKEEKPEEKPVVKKEEENSVEKEEKEEEKPVVKKEEIPEEVVEEKKEVVKEEEKPVVEMKEEKPEKKEKEENTVEKEQKPEEKEEVKEEKPEEKEQKPEEKPEEEKEEVKKVVEEEKKEEPTLEMPKEKPSRKPAEKKEKPKKPKSPKKSPMEEEEPVRATFTDPLRAADFPPTPVSIAHASPLLAPVLRSLLAAIDANHAWQETRALLDVASQLFDHHVAVMALLASHVLAVAATRPLSDPENAVQCLVLITAGNLPLTRSVSDRCVAAAQQAAAKKDAVCFAQATAVLVAFFAAWREDCFVADLAAVFLAAFAKEAVAQPLSADTAPLMAAALEKYAEVLELLPTPLGAALVGATGLNAVMAVGRALSALPAVADRELTVVADRELTVVADRELTVVVRVMAGVYRHAAKKEALVEVMVRVCAAVGQLQEASEAMVLVKAMVLELATAHGKEMKAVLQDLRRSDVRVVQSVLRKAIEEKGEGKKKRRASHVPIRLDESKFMWRVCSTKRAVTTPVLGERRLVLANRLPRLLLLGVQLLQEVRVHILVDHVLHAPALLVLVRVHRSTLHTLALTSRLVWNVEAKADGEHGEHVAAVLQLVDELHLVVPVVDEVLAVHRAARRAAHHHVRLHDGERHTRQRLHRLLLRPPRLVYEALYVRHRVCHYVCRQPRIGDLTYFAMHAVQKVRFGGRQILLQLLEAVRLRLADLAHLCGELESRQHEGDAVGVGSGGVDAEQTLVQLDCV